MPRRIDVELTSARDDGTWTWRAAGARQPKGVVPSELLYAGASVGDVVTAEADFDVDGITITSVTPPKQKAGRSGLLEVAAGEDDFQPVITNWKERAGGRDRDPYGERSGGAGGGRDGGRGGPGGGGGGGAGGRGGDRGGNRGGPRPTADWRAKVTPPAPAGGTGPRGERGDRGAGGRGAGGGRERGGGDRGGRPRQDAGLGTGGPTADRRGGQRPAREGGGGGAPRRDRPDRGPGREGGGEGVGKPRPKRLNPANTHRAAVLESLSPEQRPVAEQVLRGGIPAVRRAIEEQNNTAKASGQPEIKPGPLVALAEELLPKLKTAEWRDRAEAAIADVDEIGLRDLRSVVSGADAAARDEETRTLAASLREALERRVKKQQDDWIGEISSALDDNRLVRALRVASRPPDPSMRFPSDLALRLSGTASEAMAADTPPDRWAALLEAVAASPVRTTVKPAALPENPGEALLNAARQQAGRIPALTTLLGISMPPPPGPVRRIPPKPTQGAGGGPRPPRPPRPDQPSPAAQAQAQASAAPAEASAPAVPAEAESSPGDHVAPVEASAPVEAQPPAAEQVEASEPVEASAAPAPVATETTEQAPAPPTPVNDEPPADIPTPPEATDPVAPAEPSPAPAADDVEAPSDASVTVDGSGPGAGES